MQHFDVTVIGGGMVGLALARALKDSTARICLINHGPIQRPLSEQPELRVSAINDVNRRKFEQLGVWGDINANRRADYQHMLVWDQDSFGRIAFNAQELAVSQLGTIVENQALINALAEQVSAQTNVTVIDNTQVEKMALGEKQHTVILASGDMLSTDLLVGADGANSSVRKTAQFPINQGEYGQTAIVATLRTEHSHGNCARQVFTPYGPLALLPLADPNLVSIVWSQDSEQAHRLLAEDVETFVKKLMVVSNHCLGIMELASDRKSFLLSKQYARQWLSDGVVLCGDSAHTFHPLAGQGANLGFEDAWLLAEMIDSALAQQKPLHQASSLRAYERARKTAAVKMLSAMEGFHLLFTGNNEVKKGLRGLGLLAANAFTPAKNALARQALGL